MSEPEDLNNTEYTSDVELEVPIDGQSSYEDQDIHLVTLIEANPRLWDKTNKFYKYKDKDIIFNNIGSSLQVPMTGLDAQRRWNTLRTLYARHRKKLEFGKPMSGAGTKEVIENIFSPVFKAIHRFLGPVFTPRKTISSLERKPKTQQTFPKTINRKRKISTTRDFGLQLEGHSECSESSVSANERVASDAAEVKARKTCASDRSISSEILNTTANINSLVGALKDQISDYHSEEEKAMVVVLLHAFRRIPPNNRTKALAALLQSLEQFENA